MEKSKLIVACAAVVAIAGVGTEDVQGMRVQNQGAVQQTPPVSNIVYTPEGVRLTGCTVIGQNGFFTGLFSTNGNSIGPATIVYPNAVYKGFVRNWSLDDPNGVLIPTEDITLTGFKIVKEFVAQKGMRYLGFAQGKMIEQTVRDVQCCGGKYTGTLIGGHVCCGHVGGIDYNGGMFAGDLDRFGRPHRGMVARIRCGTGHYTGNMEGGCLVGGEVENVEYMGGRYSGRILRGAADGSYVTIGDGGLVINMPYVYNGASILYSGRINRFGRPDGEGIIKSSLPGNKVLVAKQKYVDGKPYSGPSIEELEARLAALRKE